MDNKNNLTTRQKVGILIAAIVFSETAGALGSLFSFTRIQTWYLTLRKPGFNPPNWIFGPVWTTLFFLIGVALALVVIEQNTPVKRKALVAFGVQFVLNILWSFCFFYLRSPLLGLIDIVLLIIAICITMVYFYKINRAAAFLLIPYILWVSFATVLNFSILLLNS